MHISTSGRRIGAVILAIALGAVVAAIALGGGTPQAPSPSPSPSPSTSAPPTPQPSGTPVLPSPPPSGFVIELDIAAVGPVILVVEDETGSLVTARSGRAADGMSVRWGEVDVENVDAETLRVTWAGLPRAEEISLVVSEQGDGILLDFVQGTPPSDSDAMGLDRVLVLEFDRPIRAEDVSATFPESLPA